MIQEVQELLVAEVVSLCPHVHGSCFLLQNSCSHKECRITEGKTTLFVSAARKYMHMYACKTPFSSAITSNLFSCRLFCKTVQDSAQFLCLQAQKRTERS